MDEYHDRDRFKGAQQRPSTPPPIHPHAPPCGGASQRPSAPPPLRPHTPPTSQSSQSSGGDWWHSWPAIVILFVMGLWPLALGLLVYNIVQEDQKQRQRNQAAAARWNASHTSETAAQGAIRRAQEKAEAARREQELQRTAEEAQQAIQRERSPRQAEAAQRQREQAQTAQRQQAQAVWQQPDQTVQAVPKASKKSKAPFSSKLMQFFGALFLIAGGIMGIGTMVDLMDASNMEWEWLFQAIGFLAAGGVLFWRGHHVAKMTRRSQRYILAIGNADAMSIEEIAKRVNRTPGKATKELQKLIDKGYLGEDAYIDRDRGYFLRFGATLEEDKEDGPAAAVPEQAETGYSGVLRNIRRANDRIADEVLSRKIDRLEQVSGLIFKEVEAHPEKRERIHTFFDYYLPTTQRLLDTYADFEATGVEGENLRQAKERIEQTMDAIVAGFEHQLDQLYSTDAMDVVSDIKVMETMLNRDTASAAKDFGYAKDAAKAGDEPKDGGITLQL